MQIPFLPCDTMLSQYMPWPCVRICHMLEFYQNDLISLAGFGMGASFNLSFTVLKEIRVPRKINIYFHLQLFPKLWTWKICHSKSIILSATLIGIELFDNTYDGWSMLITPMAIYGCVAVLYVRHP